ncbi:type II toxin-antitoxin system VapC family toxin [Parapedobacter sp. 10938]|uniref:type II toxin-antitoxin system VapC family toxin n=1 Tax=Parapedobacter flavus TaxID=3110225 RepID=UPI002DB97B59|nr:type II toxin-antitoxin system VapC family toxin [Parapedobacter sp. 10938]MEC3881402.1 type II toxin-antitoxin system VapC family toxin [Parapedobacter sp. 10938]
MGKGYLIDTNAVIDYLDNKLPASGMTFMHKIVDNIPNVSVITKIEVLRFNAPPVVYQTLTDFMHDSTVLGIDNQVVNETIAICKAHRIKLPDAIIAATASIYKLKLVTRNVSDFNKLPEVLLVNPHDIG